jgi:hypothetical protein
MKILIVAAMILFGTTSAIASPETPNYERIRSRLAHAPRLNVTITNWPAAPVNRFTPLSFQGTATGRDSVWNGLLIGGAVGAAGGFIWAHNICGGDDSECFFIAGPVGVLAGAGIGAAIGAVADALHH